MEKRKTRTEFPCLYCGGSTADIGEGEHIIQKSLGGDRTIPNVCNVCNNALSPIDDGFRQKSFLTIVASEELRSNQQLAWDVDQENGNILLEAQPGWNGQPNQIWPQIVLNKDRLQVRGDEREMTEYGSPAFAEKLFTLVQKRYFEWRDSGKASRIKFEQMEDSDLLVMHNYPAKFLVRERIGEINNQTKLTVGFHTVEERDKLYKEMDKFRVNKGFSKPGIAKGSSVQYIGNRYELEPMRLGLMKLAINLIADTCNPRVTMINKDTIPEAVNYVRHKVPMCAYALRYTGFIEPSALSFLKRSDNGHAFRLFWSAGIWTVYMSFFGGRLTAAAKLEGPHNEDWSAADIATPLKKKGKNIENDWIVTKHYGLMKRIPYEVSWDPRIAYPMSSVSKIVTRRFYAKE